MQRVVGQKKKNTLARTRFHVPHEHATPEYAAAEAVGGCHHPPGPTFISDWSGLWSFVSCRKDLSRSAKAPGSANWA